MRQKNEEEAIFRHKVDRILLAKGKIIRELMAMFHAFCGKRISPNDASAMENLAHYIIRASFSQERMQYLDQEGMSSIRLRTARQAMFFPPLEWDGRHVFLYTEQGLADGVVLKIM